MKLSRLIVPALSMLLLVACSVSNSAEEKPSRWALEGSWTDSCCCKVSCPCLFGSGPTEGYCEGASLLEITAGHYGDVKLDGTALVATYSVGKWTKLYISDTASPEQSAALATIVPRALPFLGKGPMKKVESVPLTVERSEGRVKFSVPETVVDIERVEGAGGEPIKLQNLPAKGTPFPAFHDHVQYKSVLLKHTSDDQSFNWSGRNGLVSRLSLEGVIEQ